MSRRLLRVIIHFCLWTWVFPTTQKVWQSFFCHRLTMCSPSIHFGSAFAFVVSRVYQSICNMFSTDRETSLKQSLATFASLSMVYFALSYLFPFSILSVFINCPSDCN
eukprot:4794_1